MDYFIHFREVKRGGEMLHNGIIRNNVVTDKKEEPGMENKRINPYAEKAYVNIQEANELARVEVQKKADLSNIKIHEKTQSADIEASKAERVARTLADIQSERELQRTVLSCTADGRVIVQRAGFDKNIHGELPVKYVGSYLYYHFLDTYPSALCLNVVKENNVEVSLFFNLKKMDERNVKKVFVKSGVYFGFSGKKEEEFRTQLIQLAVNMAGHVDLPEKHGWYTNQDGRKYAFPEMLTWKEIFELC